MKKICGFFEPMIATYVGFGGVKTVVTVVDGNPKYSFYLFF